MSIDSVLSDVGDCIGELGFLKKVKKSVSKVASKAKPMAAQYGAMTPQGQAIQAGASAMSKTKGGKPKSIPTAGKSRGGFTSFMGKGKRGIKGSGNFFSNLNRKTIFGIPALFVLIPLGYYGFKKLKRRRR